MNLEHMSDEQMLAIANPMMDNLMKASTAIDRERHVRDIILSSVTTLSARKGAALRISMCMQGTKMQQQETNGDKID